jgi:hypothetical protein
MGWQKLPGELRALAGTAVAAGLFAWAFLSWPADDLRVAAPALLCGALATLISGQPSSAWAPLAASLALSLGGLGHPLTALSAWLPGSLFALEALLAWQLGAWLTDTYLVPVLVGPWPEEEGEAEAPAESGRLLATGSMALLQGLALACAFPSPEPLVLPSGLVLAAALGSAWPGAGAGWLAAGAVLAGPVAFSLYELAGRMHPAFPLAIPVDPWLLAGTSGVAAVLGCWLAGWRRQALSPESAEPPR